MITKRLKKLQQFYSYFVVFPVIVIVQNFSAFLFPFLVIDYYKLAGNEFLKRISFIDISIILFGVGSILSVLFSLNSPVPNAFSLGIAVLPNYLYWVVAVLFFSSYAKKLDYQSIYKGVFFGVISSIVYYYTVNQFLYGKFIFGGFSQNAFSFLLIAFGPVSVYYAQEKYGRIYAFIVAIIVVGAGALSGSRSGSILTLLTGFLTLYSNKLNFSRIITLVFLGIAFFLSLQLSAVKSFIFNVNERTHDLIYKSDEVFKTDQSYLIRVAQVEKGLSMFAERPLTGAGLNTFSDYSYNFKGDFEGFDKLKTVSSKLDTLSSHNSYINLLAEGGLLVFGPFILVLVGLFLYLIFNFKRVAEFQRPFFWGLVGVSIHLYFITAIINVFVWLLIGLAASSIKYNK